MVHEGDDIDMFSGANPDRAAGVIGDNWPVLFDLTDSGYNLGHLGGQVVRSLLDAQPRDPDRPDAQSVTSEFCTTVARVTRARW